MSREEAVQYLIANSAVWGAEDYDILNSLSDQKLTMLLGDTERAVRQEAVANAARQGFQHNKFAYKFDDNQGGFIVANEDCAETPVEEEEENQMPMNKKKMTVNEWFESPTVPDEIKSVVANAMRIEEEEKAKIVTSLVANMGNAQQKKDGQEWLMTKSLDELKALHVIVANNLQRTPQVQQVRRPSFFGAATVDSNVTANAQNEQNQELLPPPTINWEDSGNTRNGRSTLKVAN